MRDYIILTEADCEMPYEVAEALGVPVFEMPFMLDGEEYLYDLGKEVKIPDFFERLAGGASFSTSCRPPWEVKEFFKKYLEQGLDILYIGLANTMSQHFQNCEMVAAELREAYPEARIVLIDTMTISIAEAMCVMKAAEMKKAGKSLDEVAKWVEENKLRMSEFFVVDDLNYLKRGGRLSATAAFFGTMLDLKPLLHCSDEGKLEPIEKIKGRKKAMRRLVELVNERAIAPELQDVIVTASNREDGEALAQMVREGTKAGSVSVWQVGPVIGGHAGPNVIAVGFFGNNR